MPASAAAASSRRRTRRRAQAHARLFPPDSSGILEAPDRDEWQQPDGSWTRSASRRLARRRHRRRRRVVHDPPRAPRRPERPRLRRRHPAADDRVDQAPREDARACKNVQPILGTPDDPRLPDGLHAVLMVDTYPQIARSGEPAAARRARARAERPARHRRFQAGRRRRAGPAARRAARPGRHQAGRAPGRPRRSGGRRRFCAISTSWCSENSADGRRFRRSLRSTRSGGPRAGRPSSRAAAGAAARSIEAMRYTLLAPSKRVRAVLVHARGRALRRRARAPAGGVRDRGGARRVADARRPARMDDAPLRRGRPSAHVAFGEAVTILAAFGLLNEAFGHLAARYDPALAQRLARRSRGRRRSRRAGRWPGRRRARDRRRRSTSRRSSASTAARPACCSAPPPRPAP